MNFNVGDKVRVSEDLEVGEFYGDYLFSKKMVEYQGKLTTIADIIYTQNFYILDIDNKSHMWTDEMLEPVDEKNPEQRKKEDENYCYGISGNLLNPGHGQSVSPGKRVVKNIIGFEEKNCDNCKYFDTYFDCSQCEDFDEWQVEEKKRVIKNVIGFDKAEEKEDLIHNPSHYTYSKHEPIDVIKAWNLDFDLGNVVKYIARCEHKGNKLQDLNKAVEYLQHEIKHLENENEPYL